MVDYLDDETGRCGQCFLFVVELVLLLWLALGESFGDLWLLLKGITNINKAKQIRNNHLCVSLSVGRFVCKTCAIKQIRNNHYYVLHFE